MKFAPLVAVVLLALVLTGAAPGESLLPSQRVALAAIDRAAQHGTIDHRSAAADRSVVNRAARLIRYLPGSRSGPLASALGQVAEIAPRLTAPRARAVFGQLAANNAYLVHRNPPATGTDITDADGVVYRYFSGRGFEFHPLGNFGALNTLILAGKTAAAERLASALIDRAVPLQGGGLGWEYYFDYAGGRAPWLSGMAQAAAAQAFTGLEALGGSSPALARAARGAYHAIPGRLDMRLSAGPWVRLYGFNSDVVLNAQLQTILSLTLYSKAAKDAGAAALAAGMLRAALTEIPRFDTGYWSYYSLGGDLSPLDYQQYVVLLLHRLTALDSRFGPISRRFGSYAKQPPAFKLAGGGVGKVRFWLSKPASVEVRSAAGPTRNLFLSGGWYDVGWPLPQRAGSYAVQIVAKDWAGNRASIDALPIVRAGAAAAPSAVSTLATATGQPGFAAGAALADPSQAKLARSRGFNTVRLSVTWPAGATAPDPATVAALQSARGSRLALELVADPLPADDAGRAALTAYAVALAQQVPATRDLLLGPPPTAATAPAYVAALASIHEALHTAVPAVAIAGELDGSLTPGVVLTALGRAFGDLGLPEPIMDELAFRPAAKAAKTAWTLADYSRLVTALGSAFVDTAQPGPTLPVIVDGVAVATRIPPAKSGGYTPPPTGGAAESDQAAAYIGTLQTAACLPTVAGVLLGPLVDNPAAGEQSGLYYADGTPKTSAVAVGGAAALAGRGVLQVCPGLAVPAAASTLTFPTELSRSTAPSIRLGCARDCLYLVTLEHAGDDRLVLATRGALRGGAAAASIRLPAAAYPAGSYRLAVQLVNQTNPGPIQVLTSPIMAAD